MNEKKETMGQDMTPSGGNPITTALDKLKTPVFWFSIGFVAAMIVTRKKKAQVIKV